jgi:hypothetical protein
MERLKPRRVSELIDIANKFLDREDAYNNKRTRSTRHDCSNCHDNQKRLPYNYEGYSSHSQVVVGYRGNNSNQGDEHQNSSYRNDSRDESRPIKSYRPRTSREYNQCGDPGLPPGIPVMHTIHDPRKIVVNPHNRVGITEIHHPLHNEFK